MLKKLILLVEKNLPVFADKLSDLTSYAAVRVPLERASGANAVTLDLPGYMQVDSFCCGVVAGFMAVKYFRPRATFEQFYARVNPTGRWGAGDGKVIRALRQSGLRVAVRADLSFDDLCAAIDAGSPVLVNVHNSGAEHDHWVVVYGYGRKPNRVFVATNGLPIFTKNAIPWGRFSRIWSPHGKGLVCERATPSVRRISQASALR